MTWKFAWGPVPGFGTPGVIEAYVCRWARSYRPPGVEFPCPMAKISRWRPEPPPMPGANRR